MVYPKGGIMAGESSTELQERIAELEAENAALRARAQGAEEEVFESQGVAAASVTAKPGRGWGRTAVAVVLVVIGLLLAPVAVISAWARLELVDTERFVATFAPLAEDPAVQAYIGDQVTAAIEEQVDIPGLTADVFDGLRQLDLPPRAEQALGLLEAPATQGLQSLVSGVVDRVVESDAFADIWATALRVTHRQFVAAMQGDPDAALAIGSEGTISVQLGPIIEAVKDRLEEQGVGFASAIPVIDRSIVVAQNDAFVLVQTVYTLAVAVGTWLPWLTLALLAAGVLIAKRRAAALAWTAGGFALSMLILASGVGIGRAFFLGAVSPSIMPADAAGALYDGLVQLMLSTILALLVLALFVAVIAWLSGPWRPARATRRFAHAGFSSVRRAAARQGVTTGAFGLALDRWRVAAYVVIAVVASVVILFNRPVTGSFVVWTVVIALLVVALVELLRRPADEVVAEPPVLDVEGVPPAESPVVATDPAASAPEPARRGG
ncbi:hypothetical protein GCM10023152_23480 [Agromyces bauzanensis]|uniref:Integral membrane protein n=2 Tax=Agromyces bauzanensis TaxID=1308924 RepID=A0A917PFX1_9MICO|nr:hypothetical protein GCM10011372_12590 [Agromyces bauzanensis]